MQNLLSDAFHREIFWQIHEIEKEKPMVWDRFQTDEYIFGRLFASELDRFDKKAPNNAGAFPNF